MSQPQLTKYVRPSIAAMLGYVSGEQPQSADVIKLNTNENPYRASESVYEAIRQVADVGLSRYPNATAQPFREAAAKLFHVPPEWIICGNGSDDILTILTRTFVGQGERLRLPYPSYVLYRTLAELQFAIFEEVRFDVDWKLPLSFADSKKIVGKSSEESECESWRRPHGLPPQLRLAFVANPNSPSGTVQPKEHLLRLGEMLPCPLVIDEAYADFADDHCVDLVTQCEKIIVTRTLSKSYSLAGLRFGFAIARPELIVEMMKVKDSYNCDALSVAAATAAIQDQTWLQETCRKILATRQRLTDEMRKLGFDVVESHANFTWNTRSDRPVKPIYEYLKSNGILVRYMNYPKWGDGLRISVGTDEQIDKCLELVARCV